jgi:acyl-CoA thioesterase-1
MLGPAPLFVGDAMARIAALSRAFATLAGELDIPFLELFTPLAAIALWRVELMTGDDAHPGAAGYSLIADLVEGWAAWREWAP